MQVLQVWVVDLLCDDAAQTQLLRRAGGGFREVVQVIDEGGAEFDGLHGPQHTDAVHGFPGDKAFHGESQPVEGPFDVLGEALEQGAAYMGVDIDDAGHDDPTGKAALDGALRDLRRGASADADDPVVLQQDPAFLVDLILFVLRDDLCAIQQCLYGRFLLYIRDMIIWYYLIKDINRRGFSFFGREKCMAMGMLFEKGGK